MISRDEMRQERGIGEGGGERRGQETESVRRRRTLMQSHNAAWRGVSAGRRVSGLVLQKVGFLRFTVFAVSPCRCHRPTCRSVGVERSPTLGLRTQDTQDVAAMCKLCGILRSWDIEQISFRILDERTLIGIVLIVFLRMGFTQGTYI